MDHRSSHGRRRWEVFPETHSPPNLMAHSAVPASQPLYAQERRPERDGSVRVLYAARVGHCRACPLREQCQGYGTATKKPRRKSRRAVASRWSTSRTCRSPCACSSLSCNPVGRLEPMPDATRVDDSTTHTNRHHHRPACRVLCRDSSKAPAHAATTGALAAQLGRATGTQCPSKDCSRCGDHPVRSSFAFFYSPGSVFPITHFLTLSRS